MEKTTFDQQREPSDADARAAIERFLTTSDFQMRRYPTGLCHYVYEVIPADGTPCVLRMSRRDLGHLLKGAQFWSDLLRPLGVPLPATLKVELHEPFPYMMLERLEGQDLGEVYPSLSQEAKRSIATSVASWQKIASELPLARGFGYAASFDDPKLVSSWTDVVLAHLNRSRDWMRIGEAGDLSIVDMVEKRLLNERSYLEDVEPRPFLHDTTTKNVLVSHRGAHGLVDVDDVCFGDRLYVLALTNMALLASKWETDYIRYWSDAWSLSEMERYMMRLYAAAFCVDFIGGLGMRFNKSDVTIDREKEAFYGDLLRSLIE